MLRETSQAKALLEEEDLTVALCLEDRTFTSRKRGVAPLLELIDGGQDWRGAGAADRVVGAGAAHLYGRLGIGEVWAPVMDRRAVEVLASYGIAAKADQVVPVIVNRAGTGPCPMEEAVEGIDDAAQAEQAIRARLERLRAETEQ